MYKIKLAVVLILIAQVAIIAFSINQLMNGEATSLTYFNIILNTVFGGVNINTLIS